MQTDLLHATQLSVAVHWRKACMLDVKHPLHLASVLIIDPCGDGTLLWLVLTGIPLGLILLNLNISFLDTQCHKGRFTVC